MEINNQSLKKFLVKANRLTYASAGEGGEKKIKDGSKEFVYRQGKFVYRDRYFGSRSFIGEEIIIYKKIIIWGMNYFGAVSDQEINSKEVYSFLKLALQKVSLNNP